MKLFKKAKKGFTLVELVVVIAVIAILAAVSVGAYLGVTESANNSQADQEAKALHTSIMLVVSDPDSGFAVDETNGNLKLNNNPIACTVAQGATHTHYETCTSFEAAIEDVTGLDYDVVAAAPDTFAKPTIVVASGAVSYYTVKGYGRTLNLKTGAIDEVDA